MGVQKLAIFLVLFFVFLGAEPARAQNPIRWFFSQLFGTGDEAPESDGPAEAAPAKAPAQKPKKKKVKHRQAKAHSKSDIDKKYLDKPNPFAKVPVSVIEKEEQATAMLNTIERQLNYIHDCGAAPKIKRGTDPATIREKIKGDNESRFTHLRTVQETISRAKGPFFENNEENKKKLQNYTEDMNSVRKQLTAASDNGRSLCDEMNGQGPPPPDSPGNAPAGVPAAPPTRIKTAGQQPTMT